MFTFTKNVRCDLTTGGQVTLVKAQGKSYIEIKRVKIIQVTSMQCLMQIIYRL